MIRRSARGLLGVVLAAALSGCAPVVPQRSKPGGAARWADAVARRTSIAWATDAALCRIAGAGIGTEGWLPDLGGYWQLDYWSASKESMLEVTIDADGRARGEEMATSPHRGHVLPADWNDSPKVWAATRRHQQGEPLSTFEADLALDAEPQRYPGRVVWRIRFYLTDTTSETHVLTPAGEWLTSY